MICLALELFALVVVVYILAMIFRVGKKWLVMVEKKLSNDFEQK